MLSVVFWPAMPFCGLLAGLVLQAASEAVIVTAASIVAHFIIVPPEQGIARHATQSRRAANFCARPVNGLSTPHGWCDHTSRTTRTPTRPLRASAGAA